MGAERQAAGQGPEADSSLHLRIRADVLERIRSGVWPPGHRLPVEHELMSLYGCSRATVNKALTVLTEGGWLIRRRKAGTFVARPKIHSVVVDIPDISAEIAARGAAYGYELQSRSVRKADADDRRALDVDEPIDVLALRCIHRADERPFALEERLINLVALPEARLVDFALTPPGTWLLGHVPWTEAEHRISAANAGRAIVASLGLQPMAACLVLERRTWRSEDRITQVRLTFPADAYDLVARFKPEGTQPAGF